MSPLPPLNLNYRLIFTSAALVLAVAGQWLLLNVKNGAWGIIAWIAAMGLMLLAQPRSNSSQAEQPMSVAGGTANPRPWTERRTEFALASIICALLAFRLNSDGSFTVSDAIEYQFTFIGVVAWFASIALFLAAFWEPEKSWAEWRSTFYARASSWRMGFQLRLSWTTLALIGVLALGLFFYLYRLDAVPAEMTSDHAEKLLDVNDILEGHHPLFFIRNTGREPIQFYWTAFLMWLTGIPLSHLALKLGTALIGFMTIPATFLLAREMFDDLTGVLAAFFVAVLHWPVAIARMGLRYPLTPFFAAISLYFVWRALKYQKRNDYLIAGLTLGAGLYGYIPSRAVPLVALGLAVLWYIVEGRKRLATWRPFALNILLMFGLMLVVFAPLLWYSLSAPEMFWYRALTRVSGAEKPIEGNVLVTLWQNLANLMLMFNLRGDEVWVTNIPEQPTLDLVSGGLLVLSPVIAAWSLFRRKQLPVLYLLAAFVALLIPSALSIAFPNENPSLVRTGAAIPFTAILLALPVAFFARTVQASNVPFRSTLMGMGLGAMLVPIVLLNFRWYFVDFEANYRQYAQNSSEVAAVIKGYAASAGDLQHSYFIGFPYWIDGRTIAIHLGDIRWSNYSLDADDFLSTEKDTYNRLYILFPGDSENMAKLTKRYPWGQARVFRSRTPGKNFVVFIVPTPTLSPAVK